MSGISKTIELMRKFDRERRDIKSTLADTVQFEKAAATHIMPIITAYEQSQKELEQKEKDASVECKSRDAKEFELGKIIDELVDKTDKKQREVGRLSSKLDTANKRIAYLGKCNDYYEGRRNVHPSQEQTDER